jgi:hypothetical protein
MPKARNKVVLSTGEVVMDLTADTVEAQFLKRGKTAHGADGQLITGTNDFDMDTSNMTARASEILSGKTAGVNGQTVTGEMPNRGAVSGTISDKTVPYTIPSGFHDGSGSVSIDPIEAAKLIPENIKAGISVLEVLGTYSGEAINVQSKSATPTWAAQTILPDSGYDYLSQVSVAAIPYTETENAAGGLTVTIG